MKACIFDLDGTLTDTLESLAFSVKETLKEMGLPQITTDECRSFVGNGARYLMERALEAAGDRELSRIEEGMEVYGRIFDETLKQMKDKGIKLAVLSNKPHQQTKKVVERIFGEDVFDCVQGQKEGIARKPDPDGIYRLLEEMQAGREECLYVGDSEVDVETGRNAGVRMVGVSWGFRSREALKAAGAGTIIDSPEKLMQFV